MKKLFSVLLVMAMAVSAMAQVTTSAISGAVVDQNGAPLIGVTIKAVHTPTGTIYATSTLKNGKYNIGAMRVGGPYTVEASYVGSQGEAYNNINLTLGQEATLDFKLNEGAVSIDNVVVVGKSDAVFNTNRTGAQEVITKEMMAKLPTLNRSVSDFTKLTPMSSGGNFAGTSYRYNNVTVDGASFNNSFGLSSSLGASGTEPISLEALDQIQVMITPFDVRNGGFTGGGINSVTKAGNNEFSGSAYFYKKSPSMQGYRQKDNVVPINDFINNQYGVSISGPIIKNKLFFYVNGEMDRIEFPISYTINNPDTRVKPGQMTNIAEFLNTQLGYNPGNYMVTNRPTQADRITARIDWNINSKNTFSFKYYYLKSFSTNSPSTSGAPANGRGPNKYAIPFSSSYYRANNNFNIFIADLNTIIRPNLTNTLKVGYSSLHDYRDMDGGFFPQVDILDSESSYTVFGTEGNSYNNKLDSDIFQIQDNLTWVVGSHQLTLGTQSDYRRFKNGYAQNYPGAWVFSSFDDFKFNVLATKAYMAGNNNSVTGFDITQYNPATFGLTGVVNGGIPNNGAAGMNSTSFRQKYSLTDDFPYAKVDVLQLGFYLQDKWTVNNNLSITLGVRVDTPIFMTDLPQNEKVAKEKFRDGIMIDVAKYPKTTPLVSPRVGVNWKPINNDIMLQVRGGTGIFTGTPPYVWISNQAGNNGVLFGDLNISGDALKGMGFTGVLDQYKPANGTAPQADISITAPDFKYPSLWKSTAAVDFKWKGWVATVESLYSKDINGIAHDNIGIVTKGELVNDGSANSRRTAYEGTFYSNEPYNAKGANNVIMLRNTGKGYSIYTTFQLQKQFTQGVFRGLNLNASYSFGTAKAVSDGSSSVAYSAWQYTAKVDANSNELGYTLGAFDGRWLVSASYTAEWSKKASTSFGLIFQRYRPFRYSYAYTGDANGDKASSNDLIYIPKDFSEAKDHLDKGDFATQEEAWTYLDNFIKQDPYLSEHRGDYAVRNGAMAPFASQIDINISHDINVYVGKNRDKKNTLRFMFNIGNFANLLNKDWGVQQTTVLGNQQYQLLAVTQTPKAANNYLLKYKVVKDPPKNTFKDNFGVTQCWSMQFGIRYSFN